ncbi:MAG: hypothetical protein GX277_07860 [Bacteroidales bacterium]|jgi:hypothetical protein|nr:hypothetical protein [Bacteroidales bacterium]HPY81847.1 hypothetical protein [Bacteroidales bacterium]
MDSKNLHIHIIVCALCIVLYVTNSTAQTQNSNIYSGGMLIVQPGKLFAHNDFQTIESFNNGIGGIMRFYVLKYATIGIYGGSQRTHYTSKGSKDSFFNVGYGGVFVGYSYAHSRFRYTFSMYGGYGSIKNLHIESQINTQLQVAHYYTHSSFIASPIASIDYSFASRLSATLQVVCLTGVYNTQRFYNPIVQLGILFRR